ncbi:MAG: hypothetical protein ACK5XO_08470, partial [Phycisphaerales bacterium]
MSETWTLLGVLPAGSVIVSIVVSPPPGPVGNANFQFEATGFLPGTIGLAVVGANPSWVPFPVPGAPAGCMLNVDPMVVSTVS